MARLLSNRILGVGFTLLLTLAAPDARALSPDRSIRQLYHTAWTAKDGAPSQISALAQTTDGFLWIGSARGLFRFDGVRFERYVPPAGVALPSNNVYALLALPDGGLWVSFRPYGLGFIKNGRLTPFMKPEELPKTQVYALAVDLDGRVWAGTHDGLAIREDSTWVDVGRDWNFTPRRIHSLFIDRAGTLWAATDTALHVLPRGSMAFQSIEGSADLVTGMAEDRGGRVWIAGNTTRPSPATGGVQNPFDPEIRVRAQNVLFDRDGGLWITVYSRGLSRLRLPDLSAGRMRADDPRIESYRESDGLTGDLGNNLLEDREGNIWVSTAKGLDRFRYSRFTPVTLPSGHLNLTLLAGENGEVRVASAVDQPLIRIMGDRMTTLDRVRGASCVYREPGGVVWWGGRGGIWRQDGDFADHFAQPANTTVDFIWEIFGADAAGGLWVSLGDYGLYHFKDGVWTDLPGPAGLPDRGPSASFRDPDGRTWLGYTENRVCVLDGDRVRAYTGDDGLDIGRIRVIRGRGPQFWLGGELGLAIFRDGRFHRIAVRGDEAFGTVSGIIETGDGTLWLNEMRSIVRIAPDEARRVTLDPQHAVNVQRFDLLDGLPGAPQMNWTCSTAIEATDGRLWFATDNGLASIDPAHDVMNRVPPPVVIRSVSIDEVSQDPLTGLIVPRGTASLRFDYTALSLAVPERVRFRYRLLGFEKEWRDAGTRREAFYTNPRPGRYRFQVIASNNDGVWNETGAMAAFAIAPAFHQTGWFPALIGVLIAGSLWLITLLRLRQMAARMQRLHDERMDERMRIAQELHDTLLQGFISASMQIHVAADSLPDASPAKRPVSRGLELMQQVIAEGRNTVRGLRSSGAGVTSELDQMFSRMESELTGDNGTGFRLVVTGRPRPLRPEIGDDVYRIGREGLVNAFRHAGARAVEIEIQYRADDLRVIVRDDGRGIDASVLAAGREGHWGLSGMRERADRIEARLAVRSRTGAGTEVELTVPGGIAFSDARGKGPAGWLSRWILRR